MQGFRREGDAYVARLDAAERAVLLDVVDDVVSLLAEGGPSSVARGRAAASHPLDALRMEAEDVQTPTDPALRRLLPDASVDPEVTAEFRRLTEADLRTAKTDHLLRLRAALMAASLDVVVVPSEAPRIAAALTDVRLVVSERLEVRTDADADALYHLIGSDPEPSDVADPRAQVARRFLATVYVVLSLLQESLVELMLEALPEVGSEPG
ncbi:DUF2017 family protein [Actinotalea sp. BY-33]|uniref:DUF2017 family protein n=1 Tax=Actinotalea soli TaxID=2819234 RepID=A0A939LPR7_9CELL|nr:DUF2017 family protein [Actinotalea soli]MBO1751694.1 DUF2017 family protein [Actinotalea soli]